MTSSKQFAKDVAKQLAKRQRRRKWMTLGAVAGLIVLAVVYLRCGRGWGIGGEGSGSGSGTGLAIVSSLDAGVRRCAIRVTAAGIAVDGKPMKKDEAVAACRERGGADVVVTGDAREGDWDELRTALDAAHVEVFVRGSQ
jgi:hypothetical protein